MKNTGRRGHAGQAGTTEYDANIRKQERKIYSALFSSFFRIGLFTFGGGYAMIPLIHREVAEKKKWVSETEVVDILALAQSIPGVIAINSASIIGFKLKGRLGAIVATIAVILPSFVIITLIAAFFARFRDIPAIQSAFRGIRPAVTALIALAVFKVAGNSIRDTSTAVIAAVAFIISMVFDVHAIFIILAGALTGMILRKAAPEKMYIFKNSKNTENAANSQESAKGNGRNSSGEVSTSADNSRDSGGKGSTGGDSGKDGLDK